MTYEELEPLEGVVVDAKRLGWDVDAGWDNEIPWKDDGLDAEVRGTLGLIRFGDTFAAMVGAEPVDPATVVVVD